MSYWVAGALVTSAVVGAASSKDASKKNAAGVKKGLNQSLDITNKARADVISLFDNASKKANIGNAAALDFYKQNAQKRMQPFIQGNQNAQNVINLGAQQANNAILGLPVNTNFAQQPQPQADYSGIMGAKLPEYGPTFADQQAAQELAAQPQIEADAAAKAKSKAAAEKEKTSLAYIANPLNQGNNLKTGANLTKKLIGKIF